MIVPKLNLKKRYFSGNIIAVRSKQNDLEDPKRSYAPAIEYNAAKDRTKIKLLDKTYFSGTILAERSQVNDLEDPKTIKN